MLNDREILNAIRDLDPGDDPILATPEDIYAAIAAGIAREADQLDCDDCAIMARSLEMATREGLDKDEEITSLRQINTLLMVVAAVSLFAVVWILARHPQ